MTKFSGIDSKFMDMAFRLAAKGKARVFPNPMVGAVAVKDGKICGKGYHKYFGGPHAEIYALEDAGVKARGGTLYVTLEPCTHWGKTPPCADVIIEAGIKRVVAACIDPNPKASGRGLRKLADSGLKVEVGLLRTKALKQNSDYFRRFLASNMHVIAKAAMSLDGKICTRTGDSKWISNERSRKLVHDMRSRQDAVIVGINTVLRDNPCLTSHGRGKNPVRVVIDPGLKIPLNSLVLNNEAPTVIFTRNKLKAKLEQLNKRGVIVIKCGSGNRIDFKHIINELAIMSIYRVLVEGGGETIAAAMDAGAVNEIMLFIAPKIIGGRDAKTPVEGLGAKLVSLSKGVSNIKIRMIGTDILLTGKVG